MKNFLAMPWILKILTLAGFCTLIWLWGSTRGVNVFGKHVSASIWWESGAGYSFLFASIILSFASYLMIRRSRHGRLVCVAGWVVLGITIVVGANAVRLPDPSFWQSLAGHSILTACVAFYLYLSKGAKTYFANGTR